MTRTNKKIQKNKLINNNNVIIYQNKTALNINDVINKLKKEYEILEYTIEYNNNFFDNILYTLRADPRENIPFSLLLLRVGFFLSSLHQHHSLRTFAHLKEHS